MAADRPPVPAEQKALDRPWRLWSTVAVGAFVVVSLVVGFLVLPAAGHSGFDAFTIICRALGIGRSDAAPAYVVEGTAVPSQTTWTAATRRSIAGGNADRGAIIAAQTCAACHGESGIAAAPNFPNLAGQSEAALFKQLHDYKSGSRQGGQAALMMGIAQGLGDQQIADVAAYYASRVAVDRTAAPDAVSPVITHLVRVGDVSRGLPSCDSCHGSSHSGPVEAPTLVGQSVPYLEQQMLLFASGERANDLYERMRIVARQLTEDEMSRLAIYYGGTPVGR